MTPSGDAERERQLDEVVASYLADVDEGRTPDRQRWLESFPELNSELQEFFADLDKFKLAAPGRPRPRNDPAAEMRELLAPPQESDEFGRFGPYRVLKILGTGGMGMVFEAEDPKLKRLVALKVMKPALAASASARKRFLQEAQSTAKIRHDHIVTIYQVGEDGGKPYLAMELLEGETLEALLTRAGKLSVTEACRIGRQIADGLAAAHKRGLIHRDIKPANIWLETQERGEGRGARGEQDNSHSALAPHHSPLATRVKLLDFGLAKAADGDAHITQSGTIVGTPAYMAPEQAQAGTVDARSDLFSLGCVLYCMVTGRAAFRGANTTAALLSVTLDHPPAPAELNPEVPAALSTLIMRLLAKTAAERPESARAVSDALQASQSASASQSVSTSVAVESAAPVVPAFPAPAIRPAEALAPASISLPVPAFRPLRRRWIAAAAILLILGPLSYFFGGTVIRFATNKGELVIEVDDKDVDIKIVQNGVVVQDRTAKREFTLTAGKGEIEVLEKDGIKLATKQFELTRGGKTTVKVALRELADARKPIMDPHKPAAPARETGPDRKAGPAGPGKGNVRLRRLPDAKAGGNLEHTDAVTHLAVSRDGARALSYSRDKFLWFWELDAPGGKPRLAWKQPVERLQSLALDPSGEHALLAILGNSRLTYVNTKTREMKDKPGLFRPELVEFAPDGRGYAVGQYAGGFTLFDWPEGTVVRQFAGHAKAIRQLAFASNGERILTSGEDNTVRLWDGTNANELKKLLRLPGKKCVIALSPDGTYALISHDNDLQFWNLQTAKMVQELKGHKDHVTAVAFGPDGGWAVSASRDKTLRLWERSAGTIRPKEVVPLANDVAVLAVAAQSGRIVAGGRGKTLLVWDALHDVAPVP